MSITPAKTLSNFSHEGEDISYKKAEEMIKSIAEKGYSIRLVTIFFIYSRLKAIGIHYIEFRFLYFHTFSSSSASYNAFRAFQFQK